MQHTGLAGLIISLICACALAGITGCSSDQDSSSAEAAASSGQAAASSASDTTTSVAAASDSSNEPSSDTGTESHDASSISLAEQNADLEFENIPAEYVISVDDLESKIAHAESFQLVDIRNVRAYASGHIEGSRCIPEGQQIELRYSEFSPDTVVLIATKNDGLAATRQTLIDLGHAEENIFVVDGGMVAWEKAGYPMTDKQMMGC